MMRKNEASIHNCVTMLEAMADAMFEGTKKNLFEHHLNTSEMRVKLTRCCGFPEEETLSNNHLHIVIFHAVLLVRLVLMRLWPLRVLFRFTESLLMIMFMYVMTYVMMGWAIFHTH